MSITFRVVKKVSSKYGDVAQAIIGLGKKEAIEVDTNGDGIGKVRMGIRQAVKMYGYNGQLESPCINGKLTFFKN